MGMASDNEGAVHTAIQNDVEVPTARERQTQEHGMSVGNDDEENDDDENNDPSPLGNQNDETTGRRYTTYTTHPETPEKSRAPGIAFLRGMLNDPDGEIAQEISRTRGFKSQHASNEKCKKDRGLFNWDSGTG